MRLGHAEVIGAVDGDPRFNLLEVLEHTRSVDRKVSHEREFFHRLKGDLIRIPVHDADIFDKCGAGLADHAIDVHRARTTDFFEASAVPYGWRDVFPLGSDRVSLNLHQSGDNIQLLLHGDDVLFPVAFGLGILLAKNLETNPAWPGNGGSTHVCILRGLVPRGGQPGTLMDMVASVRFKWRAEHALIGNPPGRLTKS